MMPRRTRARSGARPGGRQDSFPGPAGVVTAHAPQPAEAVPGPRVKGPCPSEYCTGFRLNLPCTHVFP